MGARPPQVAGVIEPLGCHFILRGTLTRLWLVTEACQLSETAVIQMPLPEFDILLLENQTAAHSKIMPIWSSLQWYHRSYLYFSCCGAMGSDI